MSTTSMQFPRRYRTLAATVAAAAATGAIAVGSLGWAAPAEATADQWVAIAYSPVDKQFGYAHAPTEEIAVTAALHNCGEVAGFCALAALAKKENCVALATRGIGEEYDGGSGRDRGRAMAAALKPLYGGQIKFSYCL
jgi:hypothetical protein